MRGGFGALAYGIAWLGGPDARRAFPVGSVFLAVVATNPATLLGYGSWTQIAGGRVLVGQTGADVDFDVAEETGGAKTHTHAGHSAHAALATHQHRLPFGQLASDSLSWQTTPVFGTGADITTNRINTGSASTQAIAAELSEAISGGTPDAHSAHDTPNSMNPYFVVYIWKRTA